MVLVRVYVVKVEVQVEMLIPKMTVCSQEPPPVPWEETFHSGGGIFSVLLRFWCV